MNIQKLGHIVLQVRDRERSEAFYRDVLGLKVASRYDPLPSTFFTLGDDHHCLAVIEVGADAPAADPRSPGLRHLAFRLADGQDGLPAVKRRLEASGARIQKMLDHGISHSIYVLDPDDNVVELYVDVSDAWHADPSLITQTPKPLKLS